MPRASPMPPAAITGTRTASKTCGTRARVPSSVATSISRKLPRCPPASTPWAMIASQPAASSQRASRTVVADRTRRPHALQQGAFGKAEMEADHLWPDPLDQFAMPAAEATGMLLDLLCRLRQAHLLEIIH